MSGILLAMQYWQGDRADAHDTLRTMIAVAPGGYAEADVVIAYREDAEPPDQELIDELVKVFRGVLQVKVCTQARGWPNGCNALWHGVMQWAADMEPDYDCVFTVEADTCPLTNDWLGRLHEEYLMSGARAVGLWGEFTAVPAGGPMVGHVNGNGMFDPRLLRDERLRSTPKDHAWDTYHAPTFRELGWASTKLIANQYQASTASDETLFDLQRRGAVFLHGVKDRSPQIWARRFLAF